MRQLKNLTIEELKKLYDQNQGFANAINNYAYEEAMFWQREESELMGAGVFDCFDSYSSFYLKTPRVGGGLAPEKVAGKLDPDYMTPENADLYKKLCELNAKMEDAEEWDEDRPEYEEMCNVCDQLANGITIQLQSFEEITDDSVQGVLESIRDECCYMGDWETDGVQVFEHITKIYK